MRYLFQPDSLRKLRTLSSEKLLLAFDFDGTLSKITRNPIEAKIPLETSRLLAELSEHLPVAVISGRSIEDLRPRLMFEPQFIFGNHGIENLKAAQGSLQKLKKICQGWKRTLELNKTLQSKLGPNFHIEDKEYSLSAHYRGTHTKRNLAKALILESVAKLEPKPRVILGKCVINLIPENAPNKGTALLQALKQSKAKHAFYIGDDDTDEDVFTLHDPLVFTVRVGKKASSGAQYFIKRQTEINVLLKRLISLNTQQKNC